MYYSEQIISGSAAESQNKTFPISPWTTKVEGTIPTLIIPSFAKSMI